MGIKSLDATHLSYAAVESDGSGTTGERAAEIMADTTGSLYPRPIDFYAKNVSAIPQVTLLLKSIGNTHSNNIKMLQILAIPIIVLRY